MVDPVDIATLDQLGDAEDQVLLAELKADLNAYLAQLGGDLRAALRTLASSISTSSTTSRRCPTSARTCLSKRRAKVR